MIRGTYERDVEQGQTIRTTWYALGEAGCVRRVLDRADGAQAEERARYFLHRWRVNAPASITGPEAAEKRCKRITYAEALKLFAAED